MASEALGTVTSWLDEFQCPECGAWIEKWDNYYEGRVCVLCHAGRQKMEKRGVVDGEGREPGDTDPKGNLPESAQKAIKEAQATKGQHQTTGDDTLSKLSDAASRGPRKG